MLQMLCDSPQIDTISFCLDYDPAGIESSCRLAEIAKERYSQAKLERLMPVNKDWNEDLKARNGQKPILATEHPKIAECRAWCEQLKQVADSIDMKYATEEYLRRYHYGIYQTLKQGTNVKYMEEAFDGDGMLLSGVAIKLMEKCGREMGMGSAASVGQIIENLCNRYRPHKDKGNLKTRITSLQKAFEEVMECYPKNENVGREEKEILVKKCMSLTMECIRAHIFVSEKNTESENGRRHGTKMQPVVMLLIGGIFMFAVIGGISLLAHYYTLNGIKSKTVGDGQHGTARFATKEEIRDTYEQIPYEPELWRKGEHLPAAQGIILGSVEQHGKLYALVDTDDVHCLMIGAAGIGKTANFLYPNLEYASACGMSFLTTDTKGDLYRNYGGIAKKYYGYEVAVIDLRNPTRSDGDNMLHLVNKYMDEYRKDNRNLSAKAKAEKYAKITAKTIISSGGGGDAASYGQNTFFYDAAEGILTAVILLIAEYLPRQSEDCPEKRHIVSVFKLIQDLMAPSKVKGRNQFQLLMAKLPDDHKAKWFAGAALNTAEQSMQSVLSTALSRLNTFLDSELEQILCFDTAIDAEQFCKKKTAIFLVMPEEDNTKYFIISLILQQLYRECLVVADENGGKLENRIVFYWDEVGTIPKIESAEMMFSASRSRCISIVPMIQSFAQLQKNYGKEGMEIIVDNCQDTIFGGFAPNSESAEVLSKSLGNKTVMSGSISRGKNDPSQSLQMIQRPLMTPDELKSLPKGNFIVSKTGTNPVRTRLKLFLKWGITFEEPYEIAEKSARSVAYADRQELEEEIIRRKVCCMEEEEEDEDDAEPGEAQTAAGRAGGAQMSQLNETISRMRQVLRTGD